MAVDKETGEITPDPRAFSEFLEDQRFGLLHAELTKDLAQLAADVTAYQKGGSLTLTIKLRPAGDGMVEVKDEVKLKSPEPSRGVALFFLGDDNSLHRENPNQQRLELRSFGDSEPMPLRTTGGKK